ncbi:hypothetical protein KIPB_010957, partial [Kipferlia bialata]
YLLDFKTTGAAQSSHLHDDVLSFLLSPSLPFLPGPRFLTSAPGDVDALVLAAGLAITHHTTQQKEREREREARIAEAKERAEREGVSADEGDVEGEEERESEQGMYGKEGSAGGWIKEPQPGHSVGRFFSSLYLWYVSELSRHCGVEAPLSEGWRGAGAGNQTAQAGTVTEADTQLLKRLNAALTVKTSKDLASICRSIGNSLADLDRHPSFRDLNASYESGVRVLDVVGKTYQTLIDLATQFDDISRPARPATPSRPSSSRGTPSRRAPSTPVRTPRRSRLGVLGVQTEAGGKGAAQTPPRTPRTPRATPSRKRSSLASMIATPVREREAAAEREREQAQIPVGTPRTMDAQRAWRQRANRVLIKLTTHFFPSVLLRSPCFLSMPRMPSFETSVSFTSPSSLCRVTNVAPPSTVIMTLLES